MEAFSPTPPDWREIATHADGFCCPDCHANSTAATAAWIDRRSPVFIENRKRKWQEFYLCQCGKAWWGWSNDRTPNEFAVGVGEASASAEASSTENRSPYNNEDSDIDYDSFFGYF
jgi:hypothetical protein